MYKGSRRHRIYFKYYSPPYSKCFRLLFFDFIHRRREGLHLRRSGVARAASRRDLLSIYTGGSYPCFGVSIRKYHTRCISYIYIYLHKRRADTTLNDARPTNQFTSRGCGKSRGCRGKPSGFP